MILVTVEGKQILLVSQWTLLKVHINPSKDSCDEWNGISVFSPPPADSSFRDAASAASETESPQINVHLVEMVLHGGFDADRPDRHYILPSTAQVRIIRKGDNADAATGPSTKRVRVR